MATIALEYLPRDRYRKERNSSLITGTIFNLMIIFTSQTYSDKQFKLLPFESLEYYLLKF